MSYYHSMSVDYEYNADDRHKEGLCPCGSNRYVPNNKCPNYRAYGYNCMGKRREPDGRVLQSPFGMNKRTGYEIGPDFGDTYDDDHREEFTD